MYHDKGASEYEFILTCSLTREHGDLIIRQLGLVQGADGCFKTHVHWQHPPMQITKQSGSGAVLHPDATHTPQNKL